MVVIPVRIHAVKLSIRGSMLDCMNPYYLLQFPTNNCGPKAGVPKGVMTRPIVDVLSELCSPILKGGNSAFIVAIASGLFPQTKYQSLE